MILIFLIVLALAGGLFSFAVGAILDLSSLLHLPRNLWLLLFLAALTWLVREG